MRKTATTLGVAGAAAAAVIGAATPATAATTGYGTLYTTVRHVQAQACRVHDMGIVRYRTNAANAAVGGWSQIQWTSGGTTPPQPWVWAGAHQIGAPGHLYFQALGSVRMRVQTKYGTSAWSAWHSVENLPTC